MSRVHYYKCDGCGAQVDADPPIIAVRAHHARTIDSLDLCVSFFSKLEACFHSKSVAGEVFANARKKVV